MAALGEKLEVVPEALAGALDQVCHHGCRFLINDASSERPEEGTIQLLKAAD